jgi:putative membrane-bound dehydrogenase-like protein
MSRFLLCALCDSVVSQMSRVIFVLLFTAATLLAAEPARAPLPPEQAAKEMKLPEGFQATVFAAEPDVVQPISFCIDDRGRLWVAEAMNYGEWKPTGKDRIVILEDTKGTGHADKRTVFYEGFNYITGIEVGFGGVYVMSPPNLYFIPDRDGDDKPDGPPEVLFDGFGYKESRHNLANGFTWGPDGWLYGGHGRTSPSDVGRPGTPAEKRIHCDGGVYRIHPTRLVFENFADGTTNPWGVDFDDYGQCFVSNCVNPHLFHMIQGGHYEPWRNRPSSQYAYERIPTIADHLHYAGLDLKMSVGTDETLALGGGHAHCGTLIYLGGSFPADFRNNVFMCNVHGHRINRDILKRVGSGYVASHGKDFAISTDPWFMGVTLRSGPDGSVFVSDWSDTGECHTYKPNTTTGRIYKISYGKPDKVQVDLAKKKDAELVKLQLDRNDWYVRHARRLLQERAAKERWQGYDVYSQLALILGVGDLPTAQRLRALWTLWVSGGIDFNKDNVGWAERLLADKDEYIRAWSVQLLCERSCPATAIPIFEEMAKKDPSPVVQLYLAAALQRLPKEKRWPIASALLDQEKVAVDTNLPLMIWYAVEPLVPDEAHYTVLRASRAKSPLVRRFLARRIMEHMIEKKNKLDLEKWAIALGDAKAESLEHILEGSREGLRGQKNLLMPSSWPALYTKFAENKSAAIREHATMIALVFDDPQALAHLQKLVRDTNAPSAERISSLEALIAKRIDKLAPLLRELLDDKALRGTAIRGLAVVPDRETANPLLARYANFTADEKRDAVATLAARKESATALLDAVERKTIPSADISAFIARQLDSLGDKAISDRLRTLWGEIRDTPADKQRQLARWKNQLKPEYLKIADLSNGRLVFSKTCQSCHKLYGEGGTIGPDLTGSQRGNLDYLLSNIIDPSAEVAKEYRMSVVATKNERIVTGIVVERTPARLVVQTATEKITIAAEDVDTIKESAVSLMPDGQLDQLTREQVRDLIAYLSGKQQVALPAVREKK